MKLKIVRLLGILLLMTGVQGCTEEVNDVYNCAMYGDCPEDEEQSMNKESGDASEVTDDVLQTRNSDGGNTR